MDSSTTDMNQNQFFAAKERSAVFGRNRRLFNHKERKGQKERARSTECGLKSDQDYENENDQIQVFLPRRNARNARC